MADLSSLGRLVAVSPHFDDAVLSAGTLIARAPGATVVTVFAGFPPSYGALTEWDFDSGFSESDDVVALRRDEDRAALSLLEATPRWLDFVDSQYEQPRPTPADVASALRSEVVRVGADTIAFPLGIDHDDHQRTHEGAALLMHDAFELVRTWIAWADVPYRVRFPELVAARLDELCSAGYDLTPFTLEPHARKAAAIAAYPSQVKALGATTTDAAQPEQLYVVTRR